MPAPALKSADLLPALVIGAASLLALAAARCPARGASGDGGVPPWLSPTRAFALAAAAVARGAEDLAGAVGAIGAEVQRSAAATARAVAEIRATDAKVQELAGGAQRIDDVVRLISGVAGQTNLLALNATIEAARAGAAIGARLQGELAAMLGELHAA